MVLRRSDWLLFSAYRIHRGGGAARKYSLTKTASRQPLSARGRRASSSCVMSHSKLRLPWANSDEFFAVLRKSSKISGRPPENINPR